MIPHPICFMRWVYRSIRCGVNVSGHAFAVDLAPTPPNIQVLRCETCREIEVCWDWGNIADTNPNITPAVTDENAKTEGRG